MRAAVYIRVSTEEQARDGVSLAVQEERCREAALAAGATSVELFKDDGYSGTKADRPALKRLLACVDLIDTVYVWKLDRLSRSVRDWANLMEIFGQNCTGFVSVTEGFDFSTSMGKAMMGMLAVYAQLFVDILRENVRAAMKHRAKRGYHNGSPPLGYDWERDEDGNCISGRPMQIADEEAAIVKRVFRTYAHVTSFSHVVRIANAEGWPSKSGDGSLWDVTQVRRILQNPTYIGMVSSGGELFEGMHDPIISDRVWQQTQNLMRRRAGVSSRSRNTTLSPLLVCGECGGRIVVTSRKPQSYGCSARMRYSVEQRHAPVFVTRQKLEAIVWAYARHLLEGNQLSEAIDEWISSQQQSSATVERTALENELARVEQRIQMNIRYASAQLLPEDMLVEEQSPLIAKREQLQLKLRQVPNTDGDLSPSELRWLRGAGIDQVERMQAMSPGKQREFLGRLFSHIEVNKRQLVFNHRLGNVPPRTIPVPVYYSPSHGHTIVISDD